MKPETGELIALDIQWFNYLTIIDSFRQFLSQVKSDKKIMLVIDNAPWHKKAARLIASDAEYSDIRERMNIVFLPPYSPDLNPIERCWRITRREKTHNRFFPCLDTLHTTLTGYFEGYKAPNDKMKSLCGGK